jgi:DNA-directed RNA polymerase specialized sigma24 family protein
MNHSEIARQLGRKKNTVKSQYYRGKKLLKSLEDANDLQNDVVKMQTEVKLARSAYVHHLSGPQQQIIDLHYIQGLSYTIIARKLGMPKGTVKSHVNRAMEFLRRCVDSQEVPVKSSSHKGSDLAEGALLYVEKLSFVYRDIFKKFYIDLLSASW